MNSELSYLSGDKISPGFVRIHLGNTVLFAFCVYQGELKYFCPLRCSWSQEEQLSLIDKYVFCLPL